MKIAVASGKGGTGKTTIATNLAVTIARARGEVSYVDCDVEEPNGHIFLRPVIEQKRPVGIPVPKVDLHFCDGCGMCGEMCQYKAIVCISGNVLTFPELCRGCGGCALICPQGAITEETKEVGVIETGWADGLNFIQGRLKVSEPISSRLISELKAGLTGGGVYIIDAPPGTSCPVIRAVLDADLVILVTEPTPFGLNDLRLAVDMVEKLGLNFGVVINRCDAGDDRVRIYCEEKNIYILAEIPDDRRIAETYSRGRLIVNETGPYANVFNDLAFMTMGLYVFTGPK